MNFIAKAKEQPARIVFPEGNDPGIITAAEKSVKLGIAVPVLLGDTDKIEQTAFERHLNVDGIEIISSFPPDTIEKYTELYIRKRKIKKEIAERLVKKPLFFAGMMVKDGNADATIAGISTGTPTVIQAASLTIGYAEGISTPSSFFIMIIPNFQEKDNKTLVFTDCAVNIAPDSGQLAEIAVAAGINARALLNIEPKIAFLSFSTKGADRHPDIEKVRKAVIIAKEMNSGFEIDGELQADAAVIPRIAEKKVKQSTVAGHANVLVFPDLNAGNICYKLVQYCAGARAIGPILQGFAKPVNDLSRGATVDDIVEITAVTSVQAQMMRKKNIP